MDRDNLTIEQRVAARLKSLRAARSLTLDDLAEHSGVSRSMISLIERAESSATAAVLDKLAASLGVTLASLFTEDQREDASPLHARKDQPEWKDPESGYLRRNLSPPGYPSAIELVEVILPPGAHVAYDSGIRASAVDQQIWLLEGSVEITVDKMTYQLAPGDCLAMRLDQPIVFRNRTRKRSRHLVALAVGSAPAMEGRFKRGNSK